jgi:glycosyltransferase involved in cell wall biosynthesis
MKSFDVVVCDDGSSEDIESVVDAFSDRLDIQYIRIARFGGPARPRNVGVSISKGRWISFLDSDDWWNDDRIERVQPLLSKGADLLYHSLRYTPSSEASLGIQRSHFVGRKIGVNALYDMITRGNPIATSAAIVNRKTFESIGGFSEDLDLIALEDFDAWLTMAEFGCAFRYIDSPLGWYSAGVDNLSKMAAHGLQNYTAVFQKHLARISPELLPIASTYFHYVLGSFALTLCKRSLARAHFAKVAFSVSPRRWMMSRLKMRRIVLTA